MHILKQEVKSQDKHVKSLRKKSLWSKSLEEVGVQLYFNRLLVCFCNCAARVNSAVLRF